jgi:hypothetical protein
MDKTVIKAWTALANITAPGATLPTVSEDAVMLEALLCDDEVAEIVRSDRDAIQLVRRGLTSTLRTPTLTTCWGSLRREARCQANQNTCANG